MSSLQQPNKFRLSHFKGLFYEPGFLTPEVSENLVAWLTSLKPIWENRFSNKRPLPAGATQKPLLRPVYWLGNWQFACLGYYHPPKRVRHCAVEAEPFPRALQREVDRIEAIVRKQFSQRDIPQGWHLNTCLVNYYGNRIEDGKRIDCARVGEHKDFEPGPVASLSFGERAFFQFVDSFHRGSSSRPVLHQWLEHGSLQIFGGPRWKEQLFHRVQRVEKKTGYRFPVDVMDFEVRRINLTFRYVPDRDIVPFRELPDDKKADVEEYVQTLAKHSDFFRDAVQPRATASTKLSPAPIL
jgi:DNA oxidative demethylase